MAKLVGKSSGKLAKAAARKGGTGKGRVGRHGLQSRRGHKSER